MQPVQARSSQHVQTLRAVRCREPRRGGFYVGAFRWMRPCLLQCSQRWLLKCVTQPEDALYK